MRITQSLSHFFNKKKYDNDVVILVSRDYYKPTKKSNDLSKVRNSSYYYQLLKNDYKLMEAGKNIMLNYPRDLYIQNQKVPKSFTLYKKIRVLDNMVQHQGQIKCSYCKINLKKEQITFDHIIPQASGGKDWKGRNLVLACEYCNRLKGCIHPTKNKSLFQKFLNQVQKKEYTPFELLMSLDKDDFAFYLNQQRERFKKEKWANIFIRLLDLYTKDDLVKMMKESKTFYCTVMYGKKQIKADMIKRIALNDAKNFMDKKEQAK
jgi:hypothetical protein